MQHMVKPKKYPIGTTVNFNSQIGHTYFHDETGIFQDS